MNAPIQNMTRRIVQSCISLLITATFSGCVTDDPESGSQPEYWEGVAFDAENPDAFLGGGAADGSGYETPTDLPTLADPEIIVSLDGLTFHLFDRATGFSEIYPVGVGVINDDGRSITPTGHFATSADTSDTWWNIARRSSPTYFGGFPFIRLTAENSRGQNTYGLHGPITAELIRGYVSHGCVRMAGDDIVRIFYLIRHHASTPVTIQSEVETDVEGNRIDLGVDAVLWAEGVEIDYGDSVGDAPPEDNTGTDADGCADDRLESDDDTVINVDSYRGLILCAGDVDRYSVTLDAGARLEVRLHFIHAIADIDLMIYGPSGEAVGQSGGTTDDEIVTVDAEIAGDYVIEVYMYGDGDSNGYSMTLAILE